LDQPITPLLDADEGEPVVTLRPESASHLFFTCDHAGRRLPRRLGSLGLPEGELERHIAWDIGAEPVARHLSDRFGATLVLQTYSRLAIDCNRPHHVPSSIPELSEETEIPGNIDLDAMSKAARKREIFDPYHERITNALDARTADGGECVLVSVHSFTPVYKGEERPWDVGLLYNRDDRLASVLHDLLAHERDLVVGDNMPYSVSDETDYTIPVHGEQRGIHHIMLEIRQDLITEAEGQRAWAERIGKLLSQASRELGLPEEL
jgi:predicted N-formylglutamate amidohydrolase